MERSLHIYEFCKLLAIFHFLFSMRLFKWGWVLDDFITDDDNLSNYELCKCSLYNLSTCVWMAWAEVDRAMLVGNIDRQIEMTPDARQKCGTLRYALTHNKYIVNRAN